jgi:membrane dipeptidase
MDVKDVADHIDHVKQIAGVGSVGLGSDFDGVGDELPTGLKDVSMYPNLIYELLKRGYSESEVEGICGKNLLRVWTGVEAAAAKLQAK